MKNFLIIFFSVILASACVPSGTTKSQPKQINSDVQAIPASLSAPISNSIIAEKDLLLKSLTISEVNRKDIEIVAAEVKFQTTTKGDELLAQSKLIIDCTVTASIDACAK